MIQLENSLYLVLINDNLLRTIDLEYHNLLQQEDEDSNDEMKEIYLQNGGGWDQKPVSVQTIDASPTSRCPSVQLNVTRAPTA